VQRCLLVSNYQRVCSHTKAIQTFPCPRTRSYRPPAEYHVSAFLANTLRTSPTGRLRRCLTGSYCCTRHPLLVGLEVSISTATSNSGKIFLKVKIGKTLLTHIKRFDLLAVVLFRRWFRWLAKPVAVIAWLRCTVSQFRCALMTKNLHYHRTLR
jgi:hypothetical protein